LIIIIDPKTASSDHHALDADTGFLLRSWKMDDDRVASEAAYSETGISKSVGVCENTAYEWLHEAHTVPASSIHDCTFLVMRRHLLTGLLGNRLAVHREGIRRPSIPCK
jgi:hypothetical protein